MSVFTPDVMVKDVTRIDKAFIASHGLKGLILDVDNTLTQYGSQNVSADILNWVKKTQEQGTKLVVASNNTKKRVMPFAKMLGLDCVYMSFKPLPFGFDKCLKKLGLSKKEVAIVGDQIYTDVLGGNLYGICTIMVVPYMAENNLLHRLRRSMEKVHIQAYRKRGEAIKDDNNQIRTCR